MIATFNIIGSLSMIIIEKKEDISLFNSLGATREDIQKLFVIEGTLISALGMIIGTILGISIVLIQQHFGLITTGTQIYPVELQLFDVVVVVAIVLLMGFVSALYTVKKMRSEE
jgi:ABC-type lipoprotein release transport system permease subunit